MLNIPSDYTVTKNNVHIEDSYRVPKKDFQFWLDYIRKDKPNSDVWKRKDCSLKLEWTTHSALYALGIARSHTKDVDLNYPQKWYITLAYNVFGAWAWVFIK